jgi:CBS domain-containing protein
MLIYHIMQRPVMTIGSQTALPEIADLLHDHHIGGLPVVDDRHRVLGIVTERDLFLKPKHPVFASDRLPSLFRQWVEPAYLIEAYRRSRHRVAAEVMTAPAICCHIGDSVGQVAWLMAEHSIGHVPVLVNHKLVGIVTRRNIVRLLAAGETWRSS